MRSILAFFSPLNRAARQFRKHRADYYEYLADVLSDSDGRILMHDIFLKDAQRYAPKNRWQKLRPHPRAVLSEYWGSIFLDTGADVGVTWRGTLPDADMLIIASAANHGGTGSVPDALKEAARLVRVVDEARSLFISIIAVAIFAIIVVLATLTSVPAFVWPQIKDTFDFVPETLYGPHAQDLDHFSKVFASYIIPLAIGILILCIAFSWSLTRWSGRSRQWAEKIIIYRVYRNYRGAMFLSTLSTLVKRGSGLNLREGIQAISLQAEPWLQWYCQRIQENIELGFVDGRLFDVGLMEPDALYYLFDISEAKSLEAGLQLTGRRTERDMGKSIKKRAFILRWSILFVSLAIVGWVVFNTFSAIQEMTNAAKMVFL
ncbi:hypothetical protein [Comamonas thiooxydans]|uniref:hypothetical protein n=1 Tax=Comamonas thiooxydans TaxID=363952 RepID=UPI0031200D87